MMLLGRIPFAWSYCLAWTHLRVTQEVGENVARKGGVWNTFLSLMFLEPAVDMHNPERIDFLLVFDAVSLFIVRSS